MAVHDVNLSALGTLIRERRKTLGLTQSQFGDRIGWTQERISVVENGKYGIPSLPTIARIAEALELPITEILQVMGYPVTAAGSSDREATSEEIAAQLYTLQRLLEIDAATLQHALGEASDQLAEVMGADKLDAFMFDRSTESLVALGTSKTPMGRLEHEVGLNRLPLANGGRVVEVYRTGEPFQTGDAQYDPEVLRGVRETLGVQSMLAVPLAADGEIRGVLVAESSQPDRFSDDDERFFRAAARWVSMIVRRAELAEGTRREVAEETRRATADEVITSLAHDLRDLLTPLVGRIDLLRRDLRTAGLEQPLHNAEEAWRSVTTIQQVVTTLLDSARLDQGLFSLALQPVDLAELVRSVVDDLRPAWKALEMRVAESLPVEGDPIRLREILVNLLSNAMRYSPKGGLIHVTAEAQERIEGQWAVVSVRDEGAGIAPELLPRLFERFSPGAGSTGLGLGLYLAHRLMEAHGGTVSVESERGKGTTFRLALPVREDQTALGNS